MVSQVAYGSPGAGIRVVFIERWPEDSQLNGHGANRSLGGRCLDRIIAAAGCGLAWCRPDMQGSAGCGVVRWGIRAVGGVEALLGELGMQHFAALHSPLGPGSSGT